MGKDNNDNFKTPEGYFESFHDRLMDKIHEEEAAQNESLIPKTDGFAVPDGYFQELPKKMAAELAGDHVKVISLSPYRKIYYGIAGAAAVLLLFFGLTWNPGPELTIEDLASSEIDAYFESNDLNLSTYELAEVVALEELELSDVLDHTFADENILEYLDDNVEHIEDLNLEYDDYE
nr:hypothetical protein [Allomuricauda sp.]